MGGMKDEAKRITIPPLFPRVHLNDTGRDGKKSMSLRKRSSLPSPTNKISDSSSTLSLSLPPPANNACITDPPETNHLSPMCNTSPTSKIEEKLNKNGMIYPTHLYNRRRALDGSNVETQKKSKTVPQLEQDVSDCSAIDSLSCMSASSNDAAKVIGGEKRFWKMRTYMINQQKIFAAQVFELHRLIMVQKMVAKSPNLVLESKFNGGKRGTMRSSHTHLLETAASMVKKTITEKHKHVTEEYPEHMKPKLFLPSINKDLLTPMWPQQLLPPPGNQWLVPVMSPSEGLVYKPYTGPCPPPSSAFMVPFCGQDSLNATFRFPVSTQLSNNYSLSPNARTNPFGQLQGWSNTSSHMTQAIPFSLKKSQESNDSDVHGSTASSPPEKHKLDVLPLFPTEPNHHTDEYQHKQQPMGRAIKAIPHNSTSASESAARIFRFIQEERRDSDHMIS
ncbi:protein HEADING DATE 3B [Raphanus sativus]|uniref:Protein HEADING DATE 3B n=1 Tax=Raphanus sativus TaxID=3726 RepID=A0A6J0P1I7_RAPSA|nr:protein HEADING DATE 3B [Raphanus sativus]XP_056867025.1 protein HEADING DATE 3B [Raphanus sativus]